MIQKKFIPVQNSNMNKLLIITFVAVTLGCLCQAADPFAPITQLKNRVKSSSSTLERYGNTFIFNTKNKLFNLKINQMQNVNTAVNKALDDTRNDIAKAKSEGKNADHCYEPTRVQLREVSLTAFSKLDKCVDDEVASLTPVKNNIDSHLTRGKLLLSELDGIAISCIGGNQIQAQICVAQKLPAASSSVSSFESTANQLKSTGDSLSNQAPASVTRCFQQPMSDMYSGTSAARVSATQCINNS